QALSQQGLPAADFGAAVKSPVAALLGVLVSTGCASGAMSSSVPHSNRAALLGSWHQSFTRAEYVRAGADSGEAADPGNWGAFVLAFEPNGRYTLLRPGQPSGAPSGRYRVEGSRIIFNCTCDVNAWHFRWSVYRDKLSLQNIGP